MSLSPAMHGALNQQLTAEFASAYLYLSMGAACDAQGWKGLAAWMRMHATEEEGHAMRFYRCLNEQGARAELGSIDAPLPSSGEPATVISAALEHEQEVSRRIQDLNARAEREGDRRTVEFLAWFVHEQVEEEKTFSAMLEEVKAAEERNRLRDLDQSLAEKAQKAVPSPVV